MPRAGDAPRIDLECLLFRRQFVMGPRAFHPAACWTTVPMLHGLHLSVHDDLPVAVRSAGGTRAALLGVAVDVGRPGRSEPAFLEETLTPRTDLVAMAEASRRLAGRWVIVLQTPGGTFALTDPCGFRQVFFARLDGEVWFGSGPQVIAANVPLRLGWDEDCGGYLTSPEFSRQESGWTGPGTIYRDCLHLLPNHVLDAGAGRQVRLFPHGAPQRLSVADAVETAASYLTAFMEEVVRRYPVRLALTAGWDSRILLAASRRVVSQVPCYVDRKGVLSARHADVWVPALLARRLGIAFEVEDSALDPPGWLVTVLSRNVAGARVVPKTRTIYRRLVEGRCEVTINGNVGELVRCDLDREARLDPRRLGPGDLAALLGYRGSPYAIGQLTAWLRDVPELSGTGPCLIDLAFWEHRLGNWAAQMPAELDVAHEELSPFNCRALIDTLLATPRAARGAPRYAVSRLLLRRLWPELLDVPFNPPAWWDLPEMLRRQARVHLSPEVRRLVSRRLRGRRS